MGFFFSFSFPNLVSPPKKMRDKIKSTLVETYTLSCCSYCYTLFNVGDWVHHLGYTILPKTMKLQRHFKQLYCITLVKVNGKF